MKEFKEEVCTHCGHMPSTTFKDIYENVYEWYWTEIARLADEAIMQASKADKFYTMLDHWVDETVDDHVFVAHTEHNYLVLLASENDQAYAELEKPRDGALCRQTYWAMRQDLLQTIERKRRAHKR